MWPERPFEAVTLGRTRDNVPRRFVTSTSRLGPLGVDAATRRAEAERHLEVLVDLFLRGMREPLPLFTKTSAAWVAAVQAGWDPAESAEKAWSSDRFDFENTDPEHVLVLDGTVSFAEMVARSDEPRPDERGPGWDCGQSTRFAVLAHRLWDDVLAHETIVDA